MKGTNQLHKFPEECWLFLPDRNWRVEFPLEQIVSKNQRGSNCKVQLVFKVNVWSPLLHCLTLRSHQKQGTRVFSEDLLPLGSPSKLQSTCANAAVFLLLLEFNYSLGIAENHTFSNSLSVGCWLKLGAAGVRYAVRNNERQPMY